MESFPASLSGYATAGSPRSLSVRSKRLVSIYISAPFLTSPSPMRCVTSDSLMKGWRRNTDQHISSSAHTFVPTLRATLAQMGALIQQALTPPYPVIHTVEYPSHARGEGERRWAGITIDFPQEALHTRARFDPCPLGLRLGELTCLPHIPLHRAGAWGIVPKTCGIHSDRPVSTDV